MKIFRFLLTFTMGWVLLLGLSCAPQEPPAETEPPVDTTADVERIKELGNQEIAALSAGDIEGLPTFYTEDAVFMPPNEPAITGQEAIQAWAQEMIDQYTVNASYSSSDVTVSGDLAIERFTGDMTLTPREGDQLIEASFKGLHVYQRQEDGSWKIAQDIWNADSAPSAAQ